VSSPNPVADLRAHLAAHGYHVFLRPDRPSGWWVTIRNGGDALQQPIEARAASREEALLLADRLFTNHRLAELDQAIRASGRTPPPWNEAGQAARVETLAAFARTAD
jgi:hypothetical protein